MKNKTYVFQGVAFAFFLVTASWGLTNASLWFDEAVEFFYSVCSISEMYEKVVSTFQPPLYNFIMHFWLKFSETEWWFRFAGVFWGFLGSVGLYLTLKRLTGVRTAALGVMAYAVSYYLVYYLQECAEYSLLIGILFWTIYFFVCLLESPTTKNIFLFTIFCVLPIYTQYGAVWLVVPACVVVFIYFFKEKNWKAVGKLCASYGIAGIVAGIPLIYFFLIPQMSAQGTLSENIEGIYFEGFFLVDLWKTLCRVIQWIFIGRFETTLNIIVEIIIFLLILVVLVEFIVSKNKIYRGLVLVAIASFLLFYFATKLGYYATNSYTPEGFGTRYSLFFAPICIVVAFYTLYLLYKKSRQETGSINKAAGVVLGIVLAVGFVLFMQNSQRLSQNWTKEDSRGLVNSWYANAAYEKQTYVYYGADYGFRYYVSHNELYSTTYEENILYQPWSRGQSQEEFKEYLLNEYGGTIPDEIYLCFSHIYETEATDRVNLFAELGYTVEQKYNGNNAILYYAYK